MSTESSKETIADIIAEKRRRADEIERDCAEKMKRGEMVSDCYARELVADIRQEADRLEAALGRELTAGGNAAKLREAIDKCVNLITEFGNAEIVKTPLDVIIDIEAILKAALAAPPRNCDVGTPDEQARRFERFCNRYDHDCTGCPCEDMGCASLSDCFANWSQMPYEAEGGGAE